MPWKTDANGIIEVQDGNPVWVYEDKKEAGFNADSALKKIGELKEECKTNRLKAADSGKVVVTLTEAGVDVEKLPEYLASAATAIETVKNLKDGDLVKANEVEALKAKVLEQATATLTNTKNSYEKKLAEKDAALAGKEASINRLLIKGAFDGSDYIREKTGLFPDIAYEYFGKRFVIEEVSGDLKAFAMDKNGEKLLSIKNAGDYAEPEEAIEMLIAEHPQRDKMLLRDLSGSGAPILKNNEGKALVNPWKKETRNLTKQMEVSKENPALAAKYKAEAGVKV